MGLQQTRFHDALRRGDHGEVHSLYTTRKTVRDSVEPNSPLGPGHGGNSVLHYAALHGMAWLFRDLLARGGKPDMRNEDAGNSLHMVCGGSNRADIRQRILRLTLEEGLTGMDVKHVLREKDGDGNMALHLAASSGLTGCVELLLAHGADIYATNKKEHTAADCAAASKYTNIATLLETKMVFSVSHLELSSICFHENYRRYTIYTVGIVQIHFQLVLHVYMCIHINMYKCTCTIIVHVHVGGAKGWLSVCYCANTYHVHVYTCSVCLPVYVVGDMCRMLVPFPNREHMLLVCTVN